MTKRIPYGGGKEHEPGTKGISEYFQEVLGYPVYGRSIKFKSWK